jgi:hypothetical protein
MIFQFFLFSYKKSMTKKIQKLFYFFNDTKHIPLFTTFFVIYYKTACAQKKRAQAAVLPVRVIPRLPDVF